MNVIMDDSQMITTIDLIRHGQVATPDLFCAPPSEPLSMAGWKNLSKATAAGEWDAVITSPSRRCHDFARLLAKRLACEFCVEPDIAEMDFGTWVGKKRDDLWESEAALLQRLWQQPRRFVAPEGEAMEHFITRVQASWLDLISQHTGKHIMLLTHAGVIRVILSHVLGVLYQKSLGFDIAYAHITRIRVYPDGEYSLVAHGLPHVLPFTTTRIRQD